MLDFNNIPKSSKYNQQIYTAPGQTDVRGTWSKPRGVIMVHILCIGCGGNGGNGFVSLSNLNQVAGGGGGGAAGCTANCLFMADDLPDELMVYSGVPAVYRVTKDPGANSFGNLIIQATGALPVVSGVTIAGNGTAAAGGAGGLNGPTSIANASKGTSFANIGQARNFLGTAALPGIIGGFNAPGTNTTTFTGLTLALGSLVTGGTGGGGHGALGSTGNAGGSLSIFNVNDFSTGTTVIPGGAGGGLADSNGNNGLTGFQPIKNVPYWIGGTGGASGGGASGNGGNGGDGGYGCGGGGGGGCRTGFTAGVGGKGGNGIIIITSW